MIVLVARRRQVSGRRIPVGCPKCGWQTQRARGLTPPAFGRCRTCHEDLRDLRVVRDAVWRHRRALAAGAASRKTYRRRSLELGKQFKTKSAAYAAGYRRGYQSAMCWWKRKAERELRRAS